MGPNQRQDFATLLGEMQSGTFGHLSAVDLIRAHPELVQEMCSFDPIKTASTFGRLLLEPHEMQELRGEIVFHARSGLAKGVDQSPVRKDAPQYRATAQQIGRHNSCHTPVRSSCNRLPGSTSHQSIRFQCLEPCHKPSNCS